MAETNKRALSMNDDSSSLVSSCERAIETFLLGTLDQSLAEAATLLHELVEQAVAPIELSRPDCWEVFCVESCDGNRPTPLNLLLALNPPEPIKLMVHTAERTSTYWRMLESKTENALSEAFSWARQWRMPPSRNWFDADHDDKDLQPLADLHFKMQEAQDQSNHLLYHSLRETGQNQIRNVWCNSDVQAFVWEKQRNADRIPPKLAALEPLIREAFFRELVSSDMVMYVKSKRCRVTCSTHDEAGYSSLLSISGGPCWRVGSGAELELVISKAIESV